MNKIIQQWEKNTGFETEETKYKTVLSRDINAYLAIKTDGTTKGKGIYYDPWKTTNAKDVYWRFQHNPVAQICVEAIEYFLINDVPIEQTIKECQNVTRFVAIRNVTGGAHKDGEYLGKTVRWYYSTNTKGTINYITSNRIVADTEGACPLMDLPSELPEDIDYEWYVKRAKDMLENMGWKAPTP